MSWSNWEVLERFVGNSKLLAMLDAGGRERLAALAQREHYAAGQAIVEEGQTGHSFYFITEGEVMVIVAEAGEVARLKGGSFFGEMGMLTLQPRSATVVAVEPVSVLCFERVDVLSVLRDFPDAREMLVREGLARTEENLDRIFDDGDEGGLGLSDLLEGGDSADEPCGSHDEVADEADGPDRAAAGTTHPDLPSHADAAEQPAAQSPARGPAFDSGGRGES